MSNLSTNELINTIRKIDNESPDFFEHVKAVLDEIERVIYHASLEVTAPNLEEAMCRASDHIQKAEIALRGIQ